MPLLDLGFVVDALADRTLVVTVLAADTVNAAGEVVRGGTSSTFNVKGSLQVASGRELVGLTEGQRTRQTWSLYSTVALPTRAGTTPPSLLSIDGWVYEVVRVDDFSSQGGYWRFLLQKVP